MRSIWRKYMFAFIAAPIALVFLTVTWFYNKTLSVVELIALIALCFGYVLYISVKDVRIVSKLKAVSSQLDVKTTATLQGVPFLCVAFDETGEVFWFNDSFAEAFFKNGKSLSKDISDILGTQILEIISEKTDQIKAHNGRQYSVYCVTANDKNDKQFYVLYLVDNTQLKQIEEKYYDTRPYAVLVTVDTVDEIRQNFKDSECGAIFGRIEEIVDNWASKFGCVSKKLSTGRFFVIAEEKSLRAMKEDKFKILEYVRSLSYADKKVNATLSVGIGKEKTFTESNDAAKAAVEMAQSRGGDQVAIKEGNDYTFFGGVSAGPERSNKVRTRIVATSFSELIAGCDNVIVMGHRYADLDAFGSAMGVMSIVRSLKKPVSIVTNKETALALPLIKKAEQAGLGEYLISPEKAKYMLSHNTLLVVVDTHKPYFTECPELLETANRIVVIDHHRKSVNHIQNAVLFFHAAYASSTCEMVTELAQYIGSSSFVDSLTAEALLSGIMLDTRSFILHTGVRTFEAAAYLKSRGADMVEVKKLFSNDMGVYKYRNQIIDSAFTYNGCAISIADMKVDDIRLITSQAADELLNIDGVKASFVIFEVDGLVCISTRSFGEMNVQVVMEKFGGGGHRTMAAAQIENTTVSEVLEKLKKEIDNYFAEA
ncbi:MAG: DHH family phosphoesterase [Acutalibacteraceae bacterium]